MPRPYFYKLSPLFDSSGRSADDGWVRLEFAKLFEFHAGDLQRIPDNFIKKVRDELSAVSTLNVPDGHVWHIGIKKVDNRFWFHEGWQDFVEHYSIGVGYFLVFRYEGNSIFNIHIFNLTTSEIDYHSNGCQGPQYGRQFHVFREMEEDDTADLFGSSSLGFHHETSKRKAIGDSSSAADHLGLNRGFSPVTMQTPFNGSMHQQQKSALGSQTGGVQALPDAIVQAGGIKFRNGENGVSKARKKQKSDLNQLISGTPPDEDSSELHYRFYTSASSRKRTATTEGRERAMNAAKIYEPVNPCCRVVVRPSYIYRGCIMVTSRVYIFTCSSTWCVILFLCSLGTVLAFLLRGEAS